MAVPCGGGVCVPMEAAMAVPYGGGGCVAVSPSPKEGEVRLLREKGAGGWRCRDQDRCGWVGKRNRDAVATQVNATPEGNEVRARESHRLQLIGFPSV